MIDEGTITDPGVSQDICWIIAGDMRYTPHLRENSHLQAFIGADAVFLDTTYCNKRHAFPPQEESVGYIVHTLKALLESRVESGHPEEPSSSFRPCRSSFVALISTYVLGKERILKAVSKATGLRLFVDSAKFQLLKLLQIPGKEGGKQWGVLVLSRARSDPDENGSIMSLNGRPGR